MKRLFMCVAVSALSGIWMAQADDAVVAAPGAAAPAKVEAPAKPACPGHCLAIKDGKALCCACGGECKCTLAEDGKTCTCGKPVVTCDLAGKFCCEKCCQVSAKEGKCPTCGGDMKACPAKSVEKPKAE